MSFSRNYAIDWIKGVMMLLVIFTHSGTISIVHHGYIAVNVFFVISGYFLMRGFMTKQTTAIQYTWSRVKQFFLPYILVFSFTCLLKIYGLTHFSGFDTFLEKYAQIAFGISLIEEVGPQIMEDHILWGSWFLSSLLIAGFLLYSMLEYNPRLARTILFPIIIIGGYTLLYSQGPGVTAWSRVGPVGLPLMRALCGMAGGAIIYDIYHTYKSAFERRSTLINIAALFSFLLFIALVFPVKTLDKYMAVAIPWIVLGAVIDRSWLNNLLKPIKGGVFSIIGRYSLYVLLVQEPSILLVHWTNTNLLGNRFGDHVLFVMDLVTTFIASAILVFICKWIRKGLLKNDL